MKRDAFAPLFVIVAASLWGIDGIVLRPALYSLPVPLVVLIESALITLLLTPVLWRFRREMVRIPAKNWLAFLGVAVFGGAIGTMSITKALFYVNFVNLSIVVLIQKLQPVVAILLAAILLKERPRPTFFLWASLAVIGAYIMTFGLTLPEMSAGDKTSQAALFALAAVVGFGASTVFSKRALRGVSFAAATYLRFLLTACVMGLIAWTTGHLSQLHTVQSSQSFVFLLIALTTGGPGIFLYYYGLQRITASVATICEMAFPLTAVILEYIIRDNILNPVQWLGVFILLFAIFKVTYVRR